MRDLVSLLAAVLFHEAGHLLTARILGIPFRMIQPNGIGAVMTFDFSRTTYLREAAVHVSGSLAGAASALFMYAFFEERVIGFFGISVLLAGINLLPVGDMDGGGILRCLLLQFFFPDTAEKIGKWISLAAVLLLWGAVLWIELRVTANLSLILFVIGLLIGLEDHSRNTFYVTA